MTVASNQVFIDGQTLQANGASRVDFVSADADLSSKAKSHSIRKPGRCVPKDSSAVNAVHEQGSQLA
jgi:hypothetical protein